MSKQIKQTNSASESSRGIVTDKDEDLIKANMSAFSDLFSFNSAKSQDRSRDTGKNDKHSK